MTGHVTGTREELRGVADRLCLAAAPTFAIMALLTAASDGRGAICSALPEIPLLGGMAPMYLMMSVFHSTPWLRLISRYGGRDENR